MSLPTAAPPSYLFHGLVASGYDYSVLLLFSRQAFGFCQLCHSASLATIQDVEYFNLLTMRLCFCTYIHVYYIDIPVYLLLLGLRSLFVLLGS